MRRLENIMDNALKENKTVPFVYHYEKDPTDFNGAFRLCVADKKTNVTPTSPSMKIAIAYQMSTLFDTNIKELYNYIEEKDLDSAGLIIEASFIHSSGAKFVEQLFIWLNKRVADKDDNLIDASSEEYPWFDNMPALLIHFSATMEQVKNNYIEFDTNRRA